MRTSVIILLLFLAIKSYSVQKIEYTSLDKDNPIEFAGDQIIYKGERIFLGAKSFFIDARLPKEIVSSYPYVFNTIEDAVKQLSNGTENDPMVLHIAPYVYWIDDPDDPAIRVAQEGEKLPYGLIIKCNWLKFHGLSDKPENVVIACNRGQTMGAKGNFTLFKMSGDGISVENITLGNYCNVDLEYPLKPELARKKRGSAIVQAQLVMSDGDKIFARNTRFISRLNLCPFYGSGKRVLFQNCHFESTDDALCKTGVYMNCTLDFYSSKPFGSTIKTGAVFLDCDLRSFSKGEQYFTKGGGQVAVLNSRLHTQTASYWGWRDFPVEESRNYQYNVSLNDQSFLIGNDRNPATTVNMENKRILDAYCFMLEGKPFYNIYNLLKGDDDWDPLGIKDIVLSAEKKDGKSYTDIPVQLEITPTRDTIETGKSSIILYPKMKRFGDFDAEIKENIVWSVDPQYQPFVKIIEKQDQSCEVIPVNHSDHIRKIIIKARSESGLEAASVLYSMPSVLDAPGFVSLPKIRKEKGHLILDYKLDLKYEDQSDIRWYRCKDKNGNDPVEIVVSRMNVPKKEYILSEGDENAYIMATVAPKHLRSNPGEVVKFIMPDPVGTKDIPDNKGIWKVGLENMSCKYQPKIMPGYWALDCYAPEDTKEFPWEADNSIDPWYYGPGINGAANDTGLVQNIKGARLRYTPAGDNYKNMKISFIAVPAKTAGQGFSSATAQYMDVFIKFDTEKMSGYALRLVRTTKYHDAIDLVFMRYDNGRAVPISEPVTTSCYKPNCSIELEARGNKLIVHAENLFEYKDDHGPEVKKVVDMEVEIAPNNYGGLGFQHTGTVRGGATLIKDLIIEWQK